MMLSLRLEWDNSYNSEESMRLARSEEHQLTSKAAAGHKHNVTLLTDKSDFDGKAQI